MSSVPMWPTSLRYSEQYMRIVRMHWWVVLDDAPLLHSSELRTAMNIRRPCWIGRINNYFVFTFKMWTIKWLLNSSFAGLTLIMWAFSFFLFIWQVDSCHHNRIFLLWRSFADPQLRFAGFSSMTTSPELNSGRSWWTNHEVLVFMTPRLPFLFFTSANHYRGFPYRSKYGQNYSLRRPSGPYTWFWGNGPQLWLG